MRREGRREVEQRDSALSGHAQASEHRYWKDDMPDWAVKRKKVTNKRLESCTPVTTTDPADRLAGRSLNDVRGNGRA